LCQVDHQGVSDSKTCATGAFAQVAQLAASGRRADVENELSNEGALGMACSKRNLALMTLRDALYRPTGRLALYPAHYQGIPIVRTGVAW
jgi:hypothetical protein